MRERPERLAYLYAAEDGLRMGDPDGSHLLMSTEGIRVRGVADDGGHAPDRCVALDWSRVSGLTVDAPVSRLGGVLPGLLTTALYAFGMDDGQGTAAAVQVRLEVADSVTEVAHGAVPTAALATPDTPASAAAVSGGRIWEFSLPGPMRFGFPRAEIDGAALATALLLERPTLRAQLNRPGRLLKELRRLGTGDG